LVPDDPLDPLDPLITRYVHFTAMYENATHRVSVLQRFRTRWFAESAVLWVFRVPAFWHPTCSSTGQPHGTTAGGKEGEAMAIGTVQAAAFVPKGHSVSTEATELLAEIARLKAENEAMRAAKAKAGTLAVRVSAKGAVSVYGLGRFPVTLYQEQWGRLLAHGDEIKAFVKAHSAELKLKGE
jgi:hypothetical protein